VGGSRNGRAVGSRRSPRSGPKDLAPGDPYDPCDHLACDTFDNVNEQALNVNAGAVAYSVLHFGMTTQDINGKRGKGNFKRDGYKPDHWGPHAIK
jgi:hypothetical protein